MRTTSSALLWRLISVAALLEAMRLILAHPLAINHDAAMYVYMGGLLREGQVPYVDMIDLNPPLVIYLSAIPAAVASALGTHPHVTFNAAVWLFTVWSVAASRRVLRSTAAPGSESEAIPAAIAAAAYLLVGADQFGQREHLFVLGFVPYFLLRCRRESSGTTASTAYALTAGALAGIVACLKPHFVLTALMPEAWWAARRNGRRLMLPPEVAGFLFAAALYAAHFLFLPDIMREALFARWLPLISSGYGAYGQPVSDLVWRLRLWLPPVAGVGIMALAARRLPGGKALAVPLCLVTAAATIGVFAQAKGWPYHAIPARIMLGIAVAVVLARLGDLWDGNRRTAGWSARARPAILAAGLIAVAVETGAVAVLAARPQVDEARARLIARDPLAAAIAAHSSAGDQIWMLSTDVAFSFPFVTQLDRRQGSRYMFAFPLPMIYRGEAAAPGGPFPYHLSDARLAAEEARLRQDLVDDLRARQPALIAVDERCIACPPGFTLHGYLEAAGLLEGGTGHYRELGTFRNARLYARRDRAPKEESGG